MTAILFSFSLDVFGFFRCGMGVPKEERRIEKENGVGLPQLRFSAKKVCGLRKFVVSPVADVSVLMV